MRLSYDIPSSWRILLCSGGVPQAVQLYKKVQGPGDPQRGLTYGDNYSREAAALRFTCNRPVMLENKGGLIGESVHAPRQSNSTYIHTDFQTFYLRDQITRTTSLANMATQTTPTGTLFTTLLQEVAMLLHEFFNNDHVYNIIQYTFMVY